MADQPGTWLAEAAAEAYLSGWALSGGPLTERATPGCAAAIAAATDHAHDPQVLEVTLNLGKLEGTWALVYKRREDLIAHHVGRTAAIWRKAAKHLEPARAVRSFRTQAAMPRETADPSWRDLLRYLATQAAAGMLHGIKDGPLFNDLVAAIEAALASAAAEGKTAALAVAAEQAGADGFDWASAYAHMYEPLTHLEDLPGMADQWVQNLIDGNAADIGRSLASLASNGGTYGEMVASVQSLTSGDTIPAVQTLIDYAMSGSASQGALNLYRSEGVTHVDWLDAGDGRVCPRCESNAEKSPWLIDEFPACPDHPLCRCSPGVSVTSISRSLYAPFLKAA